ncbi:MAG: PKD domain-containing protein, partial [Verrucomicrobiota bacterium]|nr:PKD domain-containing protein [Verrucomicrobiota bacterium]
MKKQILGNFIMGLVLGLSGLTQAAQIYVDQNSLTPIPPYTNLVNAAHSIQDALDVAEDGDAIFVAEGTYLLSSTLMVTHDVGIRSLTQPDPEHVIIDGQGDVACFNLGNTDSFLHALTIRNSKGTAISCTGDEPDVDSCIIENTIDGSGMVQGRASDCIFRNNTGAYYGGGANSTIATGCSFINNDAHNGGGMYRGAATNCYFIGNIAAGDGGGLYQVTPVGCAISGNLSGGSGGGLCYGSAYNCTFSDNHAVSGGGLANGSAYNCILWGNTADRGEQNLHPYYSYFSCLPGADPSQHNNITNNPQLVTCSHIAATSPCDNAGSTNYSPSTSTRDMDGDFWSSTPAMGCDEFITHTYGTPNPMLLTPSTDSGLGYERIHVVSGEEIFFGAMVEGAVNQVTLDFGNGETLTNQTGTALSHTWEGGNFWMILTAFNDAFPSGVAVSNLVVSRSLESTAVYVSPDGHDSYDGESWATAKATIQAGIDVQDFSGGLVLVSNGTYSVTTEIRVEKDIRIESFSGAEDTIVEAYGSKRCFNLFGSHSTIRGFTLQNGGGYGESGQPSGGGAVYCESTDSVVADCILRDNGTSMKGGAMLRGTATNCTFLSNWASNGAGALENGNAVDCLFQNNDSRNGSFGGAMRGGTALRCTFKENTGSALNGGTAIDCWFIRNTSDNEGGGMKGGTAENCVFNGNRSKTSGGGSYNTDTLHCTYTANQADDHSGGAYTGSGSADYCIFWNNTTLSGKDNNTTGASTTHSCWPEAEHGTDGNITNNPQLVSASHIATSSPCAGSGSIPRDTLDIDGENRRTTPAMGCDEPADPAVGTPSISIDGPSDVCAGFKAFFNVDIRGAIESDLVDFGDGATGISTGIVPIHHTWTTPGTYTMMVTVYNDDYPGGYALTKEITVYSSTATAIYVSTNGTNFADGRSWATAKQTIQAAIDEQDLPGGQVVVSNGVYTLTETVKITKDIQLIGLNGAEETIIDGGRTNTYTGTMCLEIDDVHATVDGFTIQNGNDRDSTDYYSGGGIFCHHSSAPQIRNCTFSGNQATEGGALAYGTAIDCVFSNNMVPTGKGGAAYYTQAQNCTFTGNSARDAGGAMYGGTATDCTFTENRITTTGSGYGYGAGMSKGTANECSFIRNESNGYGGGMNEGIANDCLFIENTSIHAGGGMRNSTATRCGFIANRSLTDTGGGMQSGTANSCYFSGNRAFKTGGGASYTTLNNCTLTGNHAIGNGGGVHAGNANHCIV